MVIKHNSMVINSSDKICSQLLFTVFKNPSVPWDIHCPQPGRNPIYVLNQVPGREPASRTFPWAG